MHCFLSRATNHAWLVLSIGDSVLSYLRSHKAWSSVARHFTFDIRYLSRKATAGISPSNLLQDTMDVLLNTNRENIWTAICHPVFYTVAIQDLLLIRVPISRYPSFISNPLDSALFVQEQLF